MRPFRREFTREAIRHQKAAQRRRHALGCIFLVAYKKSARGISAGAF
jgi:hypothetical protein